MPLRDDPERLRQYMREYQRKWIANRRAAWFADKFCVACGSTQNLQLDHINPETKVSARIWSWSAARREIELAKCQVLCEPCHLKKTIEQTLRRRYCIHGHDTQECGRDAQHRCKQCLRDRYGR